MSAKAGILALGDGDLAAALRQQPRADAGRTRALVGGIYPGYTVKPAAGVWPLAESTYPEVDVVCALSAPGVDIVCDQRFVIEKPSELPTHVLDLAAGRTVTLCAMQSVDDSFACAVWVNGVLTRSLSLSLSQPGKIVEDIGEPLEFERPFWAMRPASRDRPAGLLGFHPLDLGQHAMRSLFGFALEGRPEPDDVDAWHISTLSYQVTDPTGAERGARQVALAEFTRRSRRRRYAVGPAGSLVEIDGESGPA